MDLYQRSSGSAVPVRSGTPFGCEPEDHSGPKVNAFPTRLGGKELDLVFALRGHDPFQLEGGDLRLATGMARDS